MEVDLFAFTQLKVSTRISWVGLYSAFTQHYVVRPL